MLRANANAKLLTGGSNDTTALLRFDVIVDLARGNGKEGILKSQCRILGLLHRPDVVETLTADAAREVGMKLAWPC